MAQHNVLLSPRAAKDVKKLPKNIRDRLYRVLVSLRANPLLGKKLKGELESKYSYKIWPYRIIYMIYGDRGIVYILRVLHRQGAY